VKDNIFVIIKQLGLLMGVTTQFYKKNHSPCHEPQQRTTCSVGTSSRVHDTPEDELLRSDHLPLDCAWMWLTSRNSHAGDDQLCLQSVKNKKKTKAVGPSFMCVHPAMASITAISRQKHNVLKE